MYTLKSIARRGSMLGAAFAVLAAAVVPSIPVYADALNPLTERSLTLSSSSPGWSYTDGSGNSTYAPPNSGANGLKSGNYFSFKVSTDTSGGGDKIEAMSFQYCTTSAGLCAAPGDNASGNGHDHGGADTASTSNLRVTYPSAAEIDNADFATVIQATGPNGGSVKAVPGYVNNNPKYQAGGGTGDPAEAAKNVAGNFIVMYNNAGTWTQSTGWVASAANQENATSGTTGENNTIILEKTTGGGLGLPSGAEVKVLFFATATDYITNPGSGAFFVKINTFKNFDALAGPVPGPENTLADNIDSGDVIDGGVTVANVMNQSIQITTKVLETMEFSVGTVDPNTLSDAELTASDVGNGTHIPCGRILTRMTPSESRNVLQLGNQDAESSLETAKAYATHSYWRLSSNSSAGATVYYSGHTLSNTSGDEIEPIGTTAATSAPGSEQFGLAIATTALSGTTAGTGAGVPNFNTGSYGVNYVQDRASGKNWENGADNGKTGITSEHMLDIGATYTGSAPLWTAADADWDYTGLNKSFHTPRLDPLAPTGNSGTGLDYYGGGSGRINGNDSLDLNGVAFGGGGYDTTNARFAFDPLSDTVPARIATENNQVVDCVTAKMRYVANIAATTPAGIYTTKINYIAAPQY